eukprot:TRINITY_DN1373_c0_g1_i2.p3 TRINITY_DN1373_c0_g1~~TRINITY_DN1373_c0_g1_i2.p3  ORF type:complete len:110 (+),score=23.23 TRINITY_DN1373_c0_g1_i2:439-768(+)
MPCRNIYATRTCDMQHESSNMKDERNVYLLTVHESSASKRMPRLNSMRCASLWRLQAVTGKHTARGAGGSGRAPPEVKRLSRLMDELVVYRDDASVPRYLLLCRPARLF